MNSSSLTDLTDPRYATKECLLCGSQVVLINAYPHTRNCLREFEEKNNLQMFSQIIRSSPSTSSSIASPPPTPPSVSQNSQSFSYLINRKCDLPNSLCPGSGANNKNFVIHFKEMSFKICKLTDIKSTMVQNFIK